MAKGHPKSGGRKAGTPNKATRDVQQKLEALGCDPFDLLAKIVMGDWKGLGYEEENFVVAFTADGNAIEKERISLQDRKDAAKELAQYIAPKRKALEHSGSIDSGDRPLEKLSSAEVQALLEQKP